MVNPEIGGWYAMCCIHDLYQIKTQEELESVVARLTDDEDDCARGQYFPTLEAALEALEQDGDFERGIAYALRRHFGLPMSTHSVVKPSVHSNL